MNSTGAAARANFQIVGMLLWFALRSIMLRKLFRQVTIVAFTSLSLISASLADNTKGQRSTKGILQKRILQKRISRQVQQMKRKRNVLQRRTG